MIEIEQRASSELIDRIYEAAVLPDRWPSILHSVASRAGAGLATFLSLSPEGLQPIISGGNERLVADYFASGWGADTSRSDPVIAEQHPGFRVETDYRSVEEIEALPVHAEFLDPRGFVAGAGTAIQGARDRSLFLSIDGFPSHDHARVAVPFLDGLRPHLARAFSLTALHTQRTQLIVDSLASSGAAAAVVGDDGRLRARNDSFLERMGDRMFEGRAGLKFADPFLQQQFAAALTRHLASQGEVQSVPVRGWQDTAPFAIHLLPIKGAARELCGADGILLLIADGTNTSVPGANLLRLLFDLTPSEARLTRLLVDGRSIADVCRTLAITEATARVHLRSVFAKTGVKRQVDLVRMLLGLAAPRTD